MKLRTDRSVVAVVVAGFAVLVGQAPLQGAKPAPPPPPDWPCYDTFDSTLAISN